MLIEEYQQKAWETALETAKNPAYMVANLTSEAGEVAGKYAKWIRDGALDEEGLQKEMGDVFWQLAGLSTVMGLRGGSGAIWCAMTATMPSRCCKCFCANGAITSS